MNQLVFPTPQHQQVAETAGVFFDSRPEVDTVLIVNSCSRGVATAESDVDMAILVKEEVGHSKIAVLETEWGEWQAEQSVFAAFQQSGQFRGLHLDVIDGQYLPEIWDDGGGPDGFELEIGNQVAYSTPLNQAGSRFNGLQEQWLPYYANQLQQKRYRMVRDACFYDLDHVQFYAKRNLMFQAFDRLYKAHQEFLQMLFIGQKTYPLAYNKWIDYQLQTLLDLPELTDQLQPILATQKLEANHLDSAATSLKKLVTEYEQA